MNNKPTSLEKIEGALESLNRARDNYISGDKLAAKGDLGYAIDKAISARVNVEIEIEDDGIIIK